MSPASIGDILLMAKRSVYRYLALFNLTCVVDPKEQTCGPRPELGDMEHSTILQLLIHKPTLQLKEVQEKLFDATGTWVHQSNICRANKEAGVHSEKSIVHCIAT